MEELRLELENNEVTLMKDQSVSPAPLWVCRCLFVCVCVDGLPQQRVQRRSDLCGPGRPQHHGLHLCDPRAGVQREADLLLAEQRQEDPPHASPQPRSEALRLKHFEALSVVRLKMFILSSLIDHAFLLFRQMSRIVKMFPA